MLMQFVMDELRGYARLPLEDEVLLQTGQDILRRLKNIGYNIHAPRDDRDAILTHEVHHSDTQTVGCPHAAVANTIPAKTYATDLMSPNAFICVACS